MTVVVDTAEVPPEERFDLWNEVSLRVFEPLVVSSPARPFAGRLEHYGLGPLGIWHMTAAASSAHRTPALIRADDPENLQLMLQLAGHVRISQDDRSSVVGPGELISWQSSVPYAIDGQTDFASLMVHLPAALLRPHTDLVRSRTALAIDGRTGVGAIVRQYLLGLLSGLQSGAVPQDARGHLAEGLLDLVRAVLAQRDASTGGPERSSDVLRAQIREYIDTNLADPALTPARIARTHYISRSYLYRLFEDDDEGVLETIRTRRLERARRDLVDGSLAHESIFDIATRWGFVSKSHFSRSFRAAYGVSPSELRRDTADLTSGG